MNDKIINFPNPHNNAEALPDIPVEIESKELLESAIKRDLRDVIIIGRNEDKTFYFSSATSSKERMIYMLERMKHFIMELP